MNEARQSFTKTYQHPKTGYLLDIISTSIENLNTWSDVFAEADKIIGAQFYYSNPIMYLLADEIVPQAGACLYDNLFLINMNQVELAKFDDSVVAVNNIFIQKIGDYTDVASKLSSNFKSFHNEFGLYLVGIETKGIVLPTSSESDVQT